MHLKRFINNNMDNFNAILIDMFSEETYIDHNIHQIIEQEMMSGDKMTCILNCAHTISAGIYTLFPELGLYVSYGF